jgi:hypothetical protein
VPELRADGQRQPDRGSEDRRGDHPAACAATKAEDRFSYYIEPGEWHILSEEMLRRTKGIL